MAQKVIEAFVKLNNEITVSESTNKEEGEQDVKLGTTVEDNQWSRVAHTRARTRTYTSLHVYTQTDGACMRSI